MAVDDSEVDSKGFLVGRAQGSAEPTDELWGEIRSLRLRAGAREREAAQLNDSSDRERKLILRAESQELRTRADRLQQLARASGQALYLAAPANEAAKSQFFKPE